LKGASMLILIVPSGGRDLGSFLRSKDFFFTLQ
jgi:hypothetical protein